MWKFSMFLEWFAFYVLLLLALPPAMNSNETPTPRMCAVCLDKNCAIGVRIIFSAGSDTPVWVKANSQTGIQNCSVENLKLDAPCKMANGSLTQLTDDPLHFEGKDSSGELHIFNSQISSCADLNLPPKPSPGMCAVCLEKDCATGVREIYPAGSITTVWSKAKSPTGIQNCSMENLKPDAPCKMANGSLVLPADNPLDFDGMNPRGVRRVFHSQSLPCADLYLPPSSTPSPVTKAPNIPVADNKGIIIVIIIGSVIGIVGIVIIIGSVCIRGFIWKGNKLSNYQRGQDRDHRHGNNGVPPHDAVHRDEITNQMQPLKGEVANGKLNKVQ